MLTNSLNNLLFVNIVYNSRCKNSLKILINLKFLTKYFVTHLRIHSLTQKSKHLHCADVPMDPGIRGSQKETRINE